MALRWQIVAEFGVDTWAVIGFCDRQGPRGLMGGGDFCCTPTHASTTVQMYNAHTHTT